MSLLSKAMDLKKVVSKIQTLYPTKLAEKWDNTGLLTEPTKPKPIKKIFLTIDLTETVLEEAIKNNTDFILSYHPPLFNSFKRLTTANAKDRIVLRSVEEKIAIYSPHTSVDSQHGGVNDWLSEGLGDGKVEVLQPFVNTDSKYQHKISIFIKDKLLIKEVTKELSAFGIDNIFTTKTKDDGSESESVKLELFCSKSQLKRVGTLLEDKKLVHHAVNIEGIPSEIMGQGRLVTLKEPISIDVLLDRIKKRLGLEQVRLALGDKKDRKSTVQTIALCAGAGGEVISKVRADVFWTGEMRHHEVLDAISKGTTCVLCEHSNTERGYLTVLKSKLEKLMENDGVEIEISKEDKDPLVIV